jgi:redox-sensitive bicupin YhaK (pirin superfamily)
MAPSRIINFIDRPTHQEHIMLELRKASDRGIAHFGWLHSHHTFSFGHYRDPQQQGFSELLVINDDRVQPAQGFGTHPHNNMEIFSYVLEGALAHKDSMGTGSVIYPGDVQLMSAGTGVRHSEFNHSDSEPVHFLQIWIVPRTKAVKPSYQERHFSDADKRGRLRLIISPDGADGSLSIHQDAQVYAGLFDGEEAATLDLGPQRHAYVHVARGSVELNGQQLGEGDGVRVRNEQVLTLRGGQQAEVLVFNLPPRELPSR